MTLAVGRRSLLWAALGTSIVGLAACSEDDYLPDRTAELEDLITRSGPGRVHVPAGEYAVSGLKVPGGTTLVGGGEVTLRPFGRQHNLVVLEEDGASLESVGIDGRGAVERALVMVSSGVRGASVTDCTLTGAARDGVDVRSGASQVRLERLELDGAARRNSIRVQGVQGLEVTSCVVRNWAGRGIYVAPSADGAGCTNVLIEKTEIRDLLPGSPAPRHPIQVIGRSGAPHRNVRVLDNTVVGPGASWTNPDAPGTADQISLMWVRGFQVRRNISRAGGDVGITVSTGCVRGTIADNTCRDNDTNGIFVHANHVVVRNNELVNNGRNRQGDRGGATAGLGLRNCTNVKVEGNRARHEGGVHTQSAAVRVTGGTQISLGNNDVTGMPVRVNRDWKP